ASSLFNNGITMLSDETNLNEKVGKKDRGQLHVKNPQIINGGQTAYTLSNIYEIAKQKGENVEQLFADKEVMLKVITFTDVDDTSAEKVLELIQAISKATNQQTPIKEADRRANDKIQIELQQKIYRDFGYFYERKKGEFHDGLSNHYIEKSKVIDRVAFLRSTYAVQGNPARAVISEGDLFSEDRFSSILDDVGNSSTMFFAYMCFVVIDELKKRFRREKNNPFGVAQYGNAIRHGTYAVIYAAHKISRVGITPDNAIDLAHQSVNEVLGRWLEFEQFAIEQDHNKAYFRSNVDPATGREVIEQNFGGYYKGNTLNRDILSYFSK
ncbi:MAG: AIPR family protein, partial [Anaerolineae bacterium]|nr:AIPR family protein [Anaerolineae bacterium]